MKKKFSKAYDLLYYFHQKRLTLVLGVNQYCLIFVNIAYMSRNFWPMLVGMYLCSVSIGIY